MCALFYLEYKKWKKSLLQGIVSHTLQNFQILYAKSFLFLQPNWKWAIPEKIQTGGLRTWNFQGYWRKSMWKFQGSIKREVEFRGLFKKKTWNFQGFWFFNLEFLRGVTILLNFQGWNLVFSGISKNSRKVYLQQGVALWEAIQLSFFPIAENKSTSQSVSTSPKKAFQKKYKMIPKTTKEKLYIHY